FKYIVGVEMLWVTFVQFDSMKQIVSANKIL
ncbi:uncharacterized protein METZ01_LOCUS222720, partial [marine metagenome]